MQINDLRKLKRFKDIVAILAKYGFDDIVQHLDTPGSDLLRRIHPPNLELESYERIRAAIEDLGPTFIKFGQVMSLRPDMLPRGMLNELEKLQDNVPEVDFEEISAAVEENLGRPIREVFSMFHVDPIAAASLSQVHRAVLREGGEFVAVKVQRPDIAKNIKLDLDILEGIAGFLNHQFVDVQHYDLPGLVKVIRRTLIKELDFIQELQNMEIARSYTSKKDFYIPKTYRRYSNERLLVMEHIEGAKFKELSTASGYDREKIAIMGLNAGVKQILEDGFFHADPHPGNLLLMEDMKLCLIDWGMVGRLTEKDRFLLIDLLKAVVEKDSDALLKSFLKLCDTKGEMIDPGNLERELLEILDNYHAFPIKDMDVGQFLLSLTDLLRAHHLQMPRNFIVMIKALVTAEGSARLVYPDLDIISEISDYIHKLALRRYRPDVLWRQIRNSFAGLIFAQRQIPYQIGQVVNKLERGKLGFTFRLEKLERLLSTLEHASNRLTAGIITGSIIIGSSMIITTGVGPYLFGFPALGVVGYLLSVILGMYLIYTILRKRK
ncbi:ABC1 kinase family protein [Desulfopila inferna]|uniref:ABC1 kinase family protein n=1 Tax=Desulfopila inferna TaxID=468528 RepID=UPI0019646DEA|nr:AarF/UbiB family protein [Desulfopila inferna]MBM9603846.1 AarF/ABC1/UbiB kinase family protein [Desulfopila inferna]